jgi:hypothetical protein
MNHHHRNKFISVIKIFKKIKNNFSLCNDEYSQTTEIHPNKNRIRRNFEIKTNEKASFFIAFGGIRFL